MSSEPAVAPSPAPAGAAPTPAMTSAEVMTRLQSRAPDALNALLGTAPPPASPPAAEVPAAPAATPAIEPPVAAVAPEPEAPANDPEPPDIPNKNYRFNPKDFMEAQVILLTKPKDGKPGLTLREAYQQVYGPTEKTAAQPTAPTPTAPAPAPTAEVDSTITAVAKEIADLETAATKAADEADLGTMRKLDRELGQKERQLRQLKVHRESIIHQAKEQVVDANVQEFQQQRKMSADAALVAYPVLVDPKGEARRQYNEEKQAMERNPVYAPIFDSPDWPYIVADRVAAKHNWRNGHAAPPQAPAAPAAPPVANGARLPAPPNGAVTRVTSAAVISPSAPVNGTGFTPTMESFRQVSHTFPPEALNALLGNPPAR